MVLNSLADRVFNAARVRLMLEALAKHAKESGKHQQRQLATLNQELATMTRGMERLYAGIEKGVIKLADMLRQRTDQLRAQRQAILTHIAVLKTKATVPAHVLQQKHIDAFTRLLRAKLLESGPFGKEYLRLLVLEIRVNQREVKVTGSYAALAQAVAGSPCDATGVPRFAPQCLPDQGSNLGPADQQSARSCLGKPRQIAPLEAPLTVLPRQSEGEQRTDRRRNRCLLRRRKAQHR